MSAEQGTSEWLQEKCGNVGASRVADVMAKIKSGEAAGRRNYRAELVCELLTGASQDFYCSAEMQWGIDTEPFARAAYEISRGVMVDKTGFVMHPNVPRAGASPDGLVGEDGLVEIKCPKTATHIDNLLGKVAPAQYQLQMLWQMACTGRQYCDFVSFDPRLPDALQLFVVRFPRDEKRIAEMEDAVIQFNKEVDEVLEQLRALAG
jgi:putative phage-type endonuclease